MHEAATTAQYLRVGPKDTFLDYATFNDITGSRQTKYGLILEGIFT